MRRLAAELGVQAPSLYKHFANKAALERALIEVGLATAGEALHAAARRPGRRGPVGALLHAYRRVGITHPNLYRLLTDTPFERNALAPGLEEWTGEQFFLVTGEPHRAQSLWAFAHGMLILEINERFPPGSDLDRTWAEGARAFASRRTTPRRI